MADEQELKPLLFPDENGELHDYLPPKNKQELQWYLYILFGMRVPATAVCDNHVAPLDAIADSYFARHPISIWKASRGFGGKTKLLASLSHLEVMMGANVVLLGGSGGQSQRVLEASVDAWSYQPVYNGEEHISPFRKLIPQQPTSRSMTTTMGNGMVAINASQTSVRGHHPERLRLDEIDEMRLDIFDASMGQPMDNMMKNIPSQITASSTHQHPNGTMTEILDRAEHNGWPVYEWCYRESSVHNGGWLTDEQIDKTKTAVNPTMWRTEFDLQKPSAEDTVFTEDDINLMFRKDMYYLPKYRFGQGKRYKFQRPVEGAMYSTGCDWARDLHYTEIVTIRHDVEPARIVAYERVQHESYPKLVQRFLSRLRLYKGIGVHDSNGVGAVVADYVDFDNVHDYDTRNKTELYDKMIHDIQDGKLVSPYIETLVDQFKYVRHLDLRSSSSKTNHPPDGVTATALAWIGIADNTIRNSKPGKMLEPIII